MIFFESKLLQYTYVSFDIFDTLIFRTVSEYKEIFDIVQLLYKKLYNADLYDYPCQRIKAEEKARKLQNGKEITFQMIYSYLPYSDLVKERLKEIEKQCEIDNIVSNQCMIDILNWCRKQNKKIVLITDMYLPRIVFETIMRQINVKYDFLFISSEEGVTKRSGQLFQVVLNKLKIKNTEIIHIGDDLNNDILQPQKLGIASLERIQNKIVQPDYIHKRNTRSIKGDHFCNFILRAYQNRQHITPEFRIGYTVMGPVMFEFCTWLHRVKQECGIEKLIFVAREGYFIKQCYDLMFNDDTSYIYLNRNLLRLPLLSLDNAIESFLNYLPECNQFSWKEIFTMLHVIDHKDTTQFISAKFCDFDYNMPITLSELKRGKYNSILGLLIEKQKPEIELQSHLLNKYIDEQNILSCKIGLVNNSMNGTGQSMLEKYILKNGKTSNIIGLQFVKRDKCLKRLGNRCRAWITENDIPFFRSYIFETNCILLEHLLFEPKGTAFSFITSSSPVEVICEQPRMETKNFEFIKGIQKNAKQFIIDYRNNVDLDFCMSSFNCLLNLMQHPLSEDALILSNLYDDDINGDKVINDLNEKLSFIQILSGKTSNKILWKEGYIEAKNMPSFYLYLHNLRMMLRCYHHSTQHILADIKTICKKKS